MLVVNTAALKLYSFVLWVMEPVAVVAKLQATLLANMHLLKNVTTHRGYSGYVDANNWSTWLVFPPTSASGDCCENEDDMNQVEERLSNLLLFTNTCLAKPFPLPITALYNS